VLAGQGVAMIPRIYVEKELERGTLVAPWPDSEQCLQPALKILQGRFIYSCFQRFDQTKCLAQLL
jgi:DNA-binding transcriptional LysR family regulator